MVQFKSSYLTYLSALALCLLTLAQAYQLDPHGSCDPYKDDLVKAIDNSHEMAKEAASSLRQSGLPFVGNENVKSLVEWLFAPGNTKVVKKTLDKIATEFAVPSTTPNLRSPIIYCDFSRLENVQDAFGHTQYLYDTQNKFSFRPDVAHERCQGIEAFGKKAKAYTVAWTKIKEPKKQDFIQLCPWWLKYIRDEEKFATLPDDEVQKVNFPKEKKPWMDLYMPVEQSLIHEFSHSYLDGKGMRKDNMYLWEKCVSLTDGNERCDNADTIGFFALGVNMIKKKGQRVTKEGNFERIGK